MKNRLSLYKFYTYARSRIVANSSPKRETSKCISAHTGIIHTNVAVMANTSPVSEIREITNVDTIRKGNLDNHLYIFQALLIGDLLEELFQTIFAFDTLEYSSQRGIEHKRLPLKLRPFSQLPVVIINNLNRFREIEIILTMIISRTFSGLKIERVG
jgi:hypothetical protein